MSGRSLSFLVLLTAACLPGGSATDEALVEGLARAGGGRPFEARLSFDAPHRDCPERTRPRCAPLPRPGTPDFSSLAAAVERVVAGSDSSVAASLRAQGLAELVWYEAGAGADLARAVERLDLAVERHPSPEALNDLAVALVLRAGARDTPFDLVRALDLVEGALEADPGFAPALFNRALLLERFFLSREAASAWDAYVERDGSSAWAEEARARAYRARARVERASADPMEAVRSAVTAGDSARLAEAARLHPQRAREHGWDSLLPAWGEATLAGDVSAGRHLRAARILGSELADRSLADAAALAGAAAGEEGTALARAHRAFGEGRRRYDASDTDGARDHFLRAAAAAPGAAAPLRLWAVVWAGTADFSELAYDRATARFEEVRAAADAASHPALSGRALWGSAIVDGRRGRAASAHRRFERAAALYERAGETTNAGFLRSLLAEDAKILGRPQEAWRARRAALEGLTSAPPSERLQIALWEAADAALRVRMTRAALVLQNQGVEVAANAGGTTPFVSALVQRARILRDAGRGAEARADLRRARSALPKIDLQSDREIHLAWAQWVDAELELAADPASAAVRLDSVIAFRTRVDNRIDLADAYRARADARFRTGDVRGGEADLGRAVREVEELSATMASAADVASFASVTRSVFADLAGRRAFDGSDPDAALDLVERARRLSLGLNGPTYAGGVAARAARELPTDLAILAYAVLGERVVAWTLVRDGARFHALDAPAPALRDATERYLAAIVSDRAAEADSLGRRLFADLLPGPVRTRLGQGRVALVPGDFLAGLPFAALVDPATGRPAVERWTLTVAPTAGDLLDGLARPGDTAGRGTAGTAGALLVGDPAIDRTALPGFPALPEAAREVEALASLYPGARTLVGPGATAEAVASALPGRSVLHYAGHAVYDPDVPSASRLALAPAGEGPADFAYVRDLDAWPLDGLRLVVLSACSSVTPSRTPSGGLWGLARPFLAAGAETVVGSLWEVGDESTRLLVTRFHEEWLAGASPGAALRTAQLSLLNDASGRFGAPRFWAPFQVVGSVP